MNAGLDRIRRPAGTAAGPNRTATQQRGIPASPHPAT